MSGQKSPAGNKGWNDRLAAGNLGNRGIRWARGARWATQDGRKEGRDPRMARGGEDGQKRALSHSIASLVKFSSELSSLRLEN